MGYKFWCKRCGHNYYTVGGDTWYTSGTVTVYPKYGYCGGCVPGKSATSWSWSGNVVKLECAGCCNNIGVVSWSDWDNRSGESTGWCSGCKAYYIRRRAREKAEADRRAEAARLEAIQKRERKAAMERARIAREAEIKRQKEEAENKRKQEIETLMNKLRNNTGTNTSDGAPDPTPPENNTGTNPSDGASDPTPPENKNVYDQWMKLDTLQIVQDIGDRVAKCSAAGQDLVDNVTTIEKSLKDSLKDHYSTIEPQVDRYKGYGEEMKNMNNVFTQEFTKVFKDDCVTNIVDVWNTCDQKDAEQKKDINGINMDDPISAMKQFQDLLNKHKEEKKNFDANMDGMMNKLDEAINNITSKLDTMEKYYNDMINDNNRFITFCMEQGDDYGDEMKEIKEYLVKIGAQITPRRDLYEGQKDDEKKEFTVEYEADVPVNGTSGNNDDQKEHINKSDLWAAAVGVGVGAIHGAGVGAIVGAFGAGVGAIAGAFGAGVGAGIGAVVGGIIGGFLGVFLARLEQDEESGIELVKKTEKITLTGKDYYDGTKQKEAIQQIIAALEGEIKDYKKQLKESQEEAEQNNDKAGDFKSSIIQMRQQVDAFKNEVNGLKQKLSEANKNETFRKTMETKCKELFNKIWSIVNEIEDNSKV